MAISIVQELKTDLILHAKIRRRPNVELFDEPNSNLSQRPPPVSNRDHFLDLTVNDSELFLTSCTWPLSLSIRSSYSAWGEEILVGGGGRGRRERKAWHKTIQQLVWHIQNLDLAVIRQHTILPDVTDRNRLSQSPSLLISGSGSCSLLPLKNGIKNLPLALRARE